MRSSPNLRSAASSRIDISRKCCRASSELRYGGLHGNLRRTRRDTNGKRIMLAIVAKGEGFRNSKQKRMSALTFRLPKPAISLLAESKPQRFHKFPFAN
jgi:hypothetical protein